VQWLPDTVDAVVFVLVKMGDSDARNM